MSNAKRLFSLWLKSKWVFPSCATLLLIILTICKLSGSSLGIYNMILNTPHTDSNMVAGQARLIRSDEWQWNTPLTIAQSNNHFDRINKNVGNGQDMSLIVDVPYKDWSIIFRPHNIVFLVLPFQFAFAFKWWFMSYLLLMSCYFFVLTMLPKRRLLASMLAVGLLFTPFVQWWYQYSTIGCLYYSLFIATAFVHLIRSESRRRQLILGGVMAYLMTCFALILYPPFQIPCVLALITFGIGYTIERRRDTDWRLLLQRFAVLAGAAIVALGLIGLFVLTRHGAVQAVEDTVYPGKRVTVSGGYDMLHLFSGHTDYELLTDSKAGAYNLHRDGIANQSEAANFVYLVPFLTAPLLLALYQDRKRKKPIDWPLCLVTLSFWGGVAWLGIPHLALLSKVTLLDKVNHNRILIGLGLANLIQLVLCIRYFAQRKQKLNQYWLVFYAFLVFVVEVALARHAKNAYPGYIGKYRALIFSVPVPLAVYLLLAKRYILGVAVFAAFTVGMGLGVNPLYHTTNVISQTPLSIYIHSVQQHDNARWVAEPAYLENIPAANGARSLTGTYSYPQLGIWRAIPGADPYLYNRFAHAGIAFYRDATANQPTYIEEQASNGDQFIVYTEPCSQFLKKEDVHYLITESPLAPQSCTNLVKQFYYPAKTLYVYHIN